VFVFLFLFQLFFFVPSFFFLIMRRFLQKPKVKDSGEATRVVPDTAPRPPPARPAPYSHQEKPGEKPPPPPQTSGHATTTKMEIATMMVVRAIRAKKNAHAFSTMMRDPAGEKEVKAVGARLKTSGQLFVDNTFPANELMLFADPKHSAGHMVDVKHALIKGDLRWLRPNQMGNTREKFQVFADGIEPEDIHQVCYVASLLGASCLARDNLVGSRDLILFLFTPRAMLATAISWRLWLSAPPAASS